MLAVASLKRSLEFDPVEQGAKRKRAEMKLSPPSSPISSSTASSFPLPSNPSSSPSKQSTSIFSSSPKKTSSSPPASSSLVLQKPCSLTVNEDVSMFTYAQAAQICARLLREQDRTIREQYEELLSNKLNEQYDTFIRYTHDSVYKDSSRSTSSSSSTTTRLFNYGQKSEPTNNAISAFSYVS